VARLTRLPRSVAQDRLWRAGRGFQDFLFTALKSLLPPEAFRFAGVLIKAVSELPRTPREIIRAKARRFIAEYRRHECVKFHDIVYRTFRHILYTLISSKT
jgi:hypothetical protein